MHCVRYWFTVTEHRAPLLLQGAGSELVNRITRLHVLDQYKCIFHRYREKQENAGHPALSQVHFCDEKSTGTFSPYLYSSENVMWIHPQVIGNNFQGKNVLLLYERSLFLKKHENKTCSLIKSAIKKHLLCSSSCTFALQFFYD